MRRWNGGRGARWLAGGLGTASAVAAMTVLAPVPSLAQASVAQASVAQASPAQSARPAGGPGVSAGGAALAGFYSGGLLWSQGLNVARPIGSITKVMTALVVLRAGNLGREITVTRAAVNYVRETGESSAGLVAGDVLTTKQLLEGLLLPSGGDAAYLLAATYGPGTTAFIGRMNAAAAGLGMRSTHFASFDGMPIPTEYSTYSTPADLIRLGEAAMRVPAFRQIVAQRSYQLPAGPGHHRYLWKQTNGLIGSYPGALGIKTGYTHAAGTCLLFEARRGQRTLIGVVLRASSADTLGVAATAAARLLNWGFAQP